MTSSKSCFEIRVGTLSPQLLNYRQFQMSLNRWFHLIHLFTTPFADSDAVLKFPFKLGQHPLSFLMFSLFLAFHLLGNPHLQHFCWKKMATDETRELWFHTVCFKLISSFPLWLSSPWMSAFLPQCSWNHPINSFFWLLYSRTVGYPSLSLHSFAELLKL